MLKKKAILTGIVGITLLLNTKAVSESVKSFSFDETKRKEDIIATIGNEQKSKPISFFAEFNKMKEKERIEQELKNIRARRNNEVKARRNQSRFVDDKSLVSAKIPMPLDHQKHLYNLCKARDIDYIKALAILKHESQFNPNNISHTNDYGYMQINKGNHSWLSKKLGTPNAPLNPYINIDWGTHMLADLYAQYRARGLRGDSLDRAVWSSYNKGVAGYRKHGEATRYINRTYKEINWIINRLGLNK